MRRSIPKFTRTGRLLVAAVLSIAVAILLNLVGLDSLIGVIGGVVIGLVYASLPVEPAGLPDPFDRPGPTDRPRL